MFFWADNNTNSLPKDIQDELMIQKSIFYRLKDQTKQQIIKIEDKTIIENRLSISLKSILSQINL